jgi:hypothetical protein
MCVNLSLSDVQAPRQRDVERRLPAVPALSAQAGIGSSDEEAEQPQRDRDEQHEPQDVSGEPETAQDGQQEKQDYERTMMSLLTIRCLVATPEL